MKKFGNGDTSHEAQIERLVKSIVFLSERLDSLQRTVTAMHKINIEQNNILAGLAGQDQALYDRIVKLESRRIHLYLDEDSNMCIGQGDWQDSLETFGTPRDFADEFADKDESYIDPNDLS